MKINITTNEILIPKKIFSAAVDKELEFDASLPEYCPDIARIVKVDCTPFAESCEISDGKATVKGRAVYDVLYETDYKSRLRCCSFTQDFSHTVTLPRGNASEISGFCNTKCEKISCKLVGARRLMIKSLISAQYEIEGVSAVKAVAVSDGKDIYFRRKTIGFDGKTIRFEDKSSFTDSIALAQSEKSIGEIISGSVTLQAPQITLSPGRAEIRTNAVMRVLCEEENSEDKCFVSSKTLPITIEYQNDAIEDHKHISVSLCTTESTFIPELDQYGESRVIKAAFSVKTCIKINEPKAYTVADDVFERDYDSVPVKTAVTLPHIHSQSENSFSAEAKLPPATPKTESILDSSARVGGTSVEKGENAVTASGIFTVTLLTSTADGVYSQDFQVPFTQTFQTEIPNNTSEITAETSVLEVIPTLHSDGSITIRIIASTEITVVSETEESFVSELTKRAARKADDEDCALIYFFPQENDDLWSIAKHYRVSPESIAEENPDSFNPQGKPTEAGKAVLIKT